MESQATAAAESGWLAVSPPAKLNLFLEVTGRRDDGFHDLDMVMVGVDWRDELKIRRVPSPGVRLTAMWLPDRQSVASQLGLAKVPPGDPRASVLEIPTDERNLVARALAAMTDICQLQGGWEVVLGKRIPSGAGMGGASSDAAAAIRLAVTLIAREFVAVPDHPIHDLAWRERTQKDLALEIGSDVPFFFQTDPVCRAQGRGERLTPVSIPQSLHFVVVYPPESISTAEVYKRLGLSADQPRPPWQPKPADDLILALQHGETREIPLTWVNRLQPAARGLSSRIDEAIECFQHAGNHTAMMTGSGSACFALVDSAQQAVLMASRMRQTIGQQALIQPVASCPPSSPIANA